MRTARFFLCGRCRAQVLLCRRCDRGQRYCGSACAHAARRDSLRAAGRRYQSTRAGRFAHADRSRRYRQRCNNVTHHSPPLVPDGSRLKGPPKEGIVALGDGTAGVVPSIEPWCRRCGSSVPLFFRRGFVRRRGTHVRPFDHGDRTDDHICRERSDDPAPVPR